LSTADWSPAASLRQTIDTWLKTQYDNVAVLKNRLEEFGRRMNEDEAMPANVLGALLTRTSKKHDAIIGWKRAQAGIEALSAHLEESRAEALAREPINPERLKQLGTFASLTGFAPGTAEFPLPLFRSIEFRAENFQDFRLTTRSVRKGELTKTEIEQRAANEDDFWSRTMADHVGALVLSDVIRELAISDALVLDANSYWEALKSEAARFRDMGQHPVLVLDNATRPEWVWEWQHANYEEARHPKPEDLSVRKLNGQGSSYVCHFNDIPVYSGRLPLGQSLVLPLEALQRIEFKEYETGRYADASIVERADNKLLVDLVMTISRRVHVGGQNAARLRYATLEPHGSPKK
jgi:hypothetical protein